MSVRSLLVALLIPARRFGQMSPQPKSILPISHDNLELFSLNSSTKLKFYSILPGNQCPMRLTSVNQREKRLFLSCREFPRWYHRAITLSVPSAIGSQPSAFGLPLRDVGIGQKETNYLLDKSHPWNPPLLNAARFNIFLREIMRYIPLFSGVLGIKAQATKSYGGLERSSSNGIPTSVAAGKRCGRNRRDSPYALASATGGDGRIGFFRPQTRSGHQLGCSELSLLQRFRVSS